MKLLNLSLLLSLSTLLAGNILAKPQDEIKGETKDSRDSLIQNSPKFAEIYSNISSKCKDYFVKNYESCVDYVISDSTFKYTCDKAGSTECQYLMNHIQENDMAEHCSENNNDKLLSYYVSDRKGAFAELCTRDENDQPCGIMFTKEIEDKKNNSTTFVIEKESAQNTCLSEKCTKAVEIRLKTFPDSRIFYNSVYDAKKAYDLKEYIEAIKTCPHFKLAQNETDQIVKDSIKKLEEVSDKKLENNNQKDSTSGSSTQRVGILSLFISAVSLLLMKNLF